MNFDIEKDIEIFSSLFQKRPEVIPDRLKQDLSKYYLPFIQKLLDLKEKKITLNAFIVGVSAIQGTGKTTQGEILEILLKHMGYSSVSLSIDDHYITHKELVSLRNEDPRYIRRGVTHDIALALKDLYHLQVMKDGDPILICGYDKGAHHGDGDRFAWVNPIPKLKMTARVIEEEAVVNKENQTIKSLKLRSLEYKGEEVFLPTYMGSNIPLVEHFLPEDLRSFLLSSVEEIVISEIEEGMVEFRGERSFKIAKDQLPKGWRLVTKKPDFIFYDGWMLGVRRVIDESVFSSGLPALETEEARQFARDVNKKLSRYEDLWEMIDFMSVLYVVNYEQSLLWRDQAEESLRKHGEGMSHEEITEFVHYFWRSVHPGIHIKNLAQDSSNTHQVVIIDDTHCVSEVLTPDEVAARYP